MPSVTTSSRVSLVNWRSKRMCQPISRPTVQPRSSAMRFAIARAATRRGCSSSTRPRSTSAGGTRVVLPAPGAAVSTAARWRSSAARMASSAESTGRAGSTEYHQSLPPGVFVAIHGELRNTLEPDPVHTGGGRAEMSKSTPVPTANTFAEAFPNSTKVFDETFVDTPTAASIARAGSRGGVERRRAAGSSLRHQRSAGPRSAAGPAEAARVVDRAAPRGREGRQGRDAAALRAQRRDHAGDGSSSPRAKGCPPISFATKWRAAAPSFPPTSITPSSSR